MLNKITNYFKGLMDSETTQSSTRFAFLFAVVISNLVLWFTWLGFCIYTSTIVNIPDGVCAALAISNGVAFTGKVANSYMENKSTNEKSEENKK